MTECDSDAPEDNAKSPIEDHAPSKVNKLTPNPNIKDEMDIDNEPLHGDDDTEYSSSFGDSFDAELTDEEQSDADSSKTFRVCKRKKLTMHWQRYIRYVKYRCNRLELMIKELQYRNLKRKQFLLAADPENAEKLLMKRRRRKREEEKDDLVSYIPSHFVFSLLEKGSEPDPFSLDDGPAENGLPDGSAKGQDSLAVDHDWPTIDPEDSKSHQETVYLLIEALQERVAKLRAELDGGFHPETLTFAANMPLPERGASGSPSGTPVYESDGVAASGCMLSSEDGQRSPPPNIIASTVDLLSADRAAQIDHGDDILISNRAAKEELEDFESLGKQAERGSDGARVSGSETDSDPERAASEQPVAMRRCSKRAVTYVRRSNRPPARRRLSPSSWHCETIGPRRPTKPRDHS